MSPYITQVTYYMPNEGFFYAYCNQAKYYCTWDITTNRIGFIDESAYNANLSNLNIVSASGLDDMTLTIDPVASSEDPAIARKFIKIIIFCLYNYSLLPGAYLRGR